MRALLSNGVYWASERRTIFADARENTATTHTPADRGVPIYWLGGPRTAHDYADFYDGAWDHSNPVRDEHGTEWRLGTARGDHVWTGSNPDGSWRIDNPGTSESESNYIGDSSPGTGAPGRGAGHELSSSVESASQNVHLYGLSGVFRVEGEAAVDNAELSDLRVDGTSVAGFAAATTSYTVGVADTVDQVTIAASTADPDATLAYGVDADPDAGGHQVDLIPGANTVAVTVTAQDTTTTKIYTLTISRADAPEVNSAAVSEDGMSIRLVFDQDLDATSLPAASAFAVAVGTAPAVAPSGVAVPATDADTVVLTMSAAIAAGQTVSLDYTAPATGGLQGALGGVVESFTREVVNRLDAPAAVRAFAGNERFDVEWDAPASGATVSGYRVQWKVPSGSYDTTNSADVAGEVLEHAVTGLTNGDAYVVRVRALNSAGVAGAGAESEPVTVGRPRAVRNARATGRKADFRVDWEAPVERGEGFLKDADDNPVLVYRISWEREGQSQDLAQYQAICRDGSRKTSVNGWLEVTDVSPYEYTSPGDGDTYSFTIQARFQAGTEVVLKGCHGQTGYGEEAQATATEGRATASAADHAALRAALESFVDARDEGWPWLRTVWDHISGLVVAEDLDPRRDGETDLQCTSTNSGDTLSGCSFNGLSIDLDWDLLGEEGFDYVAVHELAHVWTLASALHDRETRTPVGHAVLYFLGQEYSGDSEVMEACALETLGDTVSHVAEGVAPTRLTYYGDRCFSDGRSEPAELSEAVVLHALHPSGTAPGGNAGEAASSWFADAYTGASAGADAWAAVMDIDTNKRRALMTNLLQDKFGGYCSIGAANRAFFVDGSDITDPWQDGGCAPDAPAVTATAGAAAGSIAVSWTAPASGGAPLLGYKVQWKPASDEWPAPDSVVPPREADLDDPSAVSHTITGLNAGAEYTVRVRADNSIGDGDFSGDATVTSGGTVNRSAPPPPQNLRAVMEEGAVKLTWDAPEDDTVTSYRIDRRRSGGGRGEAQTLVEDTGSADTGYTDKSAETGVEYQYRVSARNQAGPGQASEWVSAAPAPESNTPATGAPTIGGTAQVGETLTADTSGIADTDGLDKRDLQLPVERQRRKRGDRHNRRHGLNLHPGGCR